MNGDERATKFRIGGMLAAYDFTNDQASVGFDRLDRGGLIETQFYVAATRHVFATRHDTILHALTRLSFGLVRLGW
jgi:hypothetical protein